MEKASPSIYERRRIEAEILGRVYDSLAPQVGESTALDVICQATASAARDAGRSFAAAAWPEPCLEHFATVVELWRAGGALEIADVSLTKTELKFVVLRCAYLEMYRAMGLGAAMCNALSCVRDAAFVQGYSPHLIMERPFTLAMDEKPCRFRFVWGQG